MFCLEFRFNKTQLMFSKNQMYKSATPMKLNTYSKAGLKKILHNLQINLLHFPALEGRYRRPFYYANYFTS